MTWLTVIKTKILLYKENWYSLNFRNWGYVNVTNFIANYGGGYKYDNRILCAYSVSSELIIFEKKMLLTHF